MLETAESFWKLLSKMCGSTFSMMKQSNLKAEIEWEAKHCTIAGLPHWRIYRQIPEIWRILTAFDYKYFGLANFWRFFASLWLQLFGLAKCTTCVFVRIAYTFICRFTIFKLADGLKIRDIKWKCEKCESTSMVVKTSYQRCLQIIETDYLEMFAKCWKPIRFLVKYKAKDRRALKDWFPVKKINVLVKVPPFPDFGKLLLSLTVSFGDSFLFLSGNPVR